jgi:hypothetical protein
MICACKTNIFDTFFGTGPESERKKEHFSKSVYKLSLALNLSVTFLNLHFDWGEKE